MIRRPPDAGAPGFDRTFTRRSLRPDPKSRFGALLDRVGDVALVVVVLVILFGGFFMKACG